MKKIYFLLILSISAFVSNFSIAQESDKINREDCSFGNFKLYGKIQFVTSDADIKVQIVESFPDLEVKIVESFPDDCGEWQIVDSFPDLKIQIVESFPDLKVKFVESFPGMP